MGKTIAKRKKPDHTARIVAGITGYSVDMVKRVRNGERHNEEIMATLVDYEQGHKKLVKYLEKLIPMEGKRIRKGRVLAKL